MAERVFAFGSDPELWAEIADRMGYEMGEDMVDLNDRAERIDIVQTVCEALEALIHE